MSGVQLFLFFRGTRFGSQVPPENATVLVVAGGLRTKPGRMVVSWGVFQDLRATEGRGPGRPAADPVVGRPAFGRRLLNWGPGTPEEDQRAAGRPSFGALELCGARGGWR